MTPHQTFTLNSWWKCRSFTARFSDSHKRLFCQLKIPRRVNVASSVKSLRQQILHWSVVIKMKLLFDQNSTNRFNVCPFPHLNDDYLHLDLRTLQPKLPLPDQPISFLEPLFSLLGQKDPFSPKRLYKCLNNLWFGGLPREKYITKNFYRTKNRRAANFQVDSSRTTMIIVKKENKIITWNHPVFPKPSTFGQGMFGSIIPIQPLVSAVNGCPIVNETQCIKHVAI